MRKTRKYTWARTGGQIALLTAATTLALLFLSCSPQPKQGVPVSADLAVVKDATAVRIVTLERQTFRSYLELTGTLEARNQIQVTVEEGGIVRELAADKGEQAEQGQVLARLSNPLVDAAYKQAQAVLRQAELSYNSKRVLFDNKAISENEFLLSRYSYEAAQAAYDMARTRVDKLSVQAPIAGYVNNRYYDLGAYATPLTPIFEMIDAGVVRVRVGVAERFRGDIEIGTPVEITFDAYPDWKPIETHVRFISHAVDPRSRTFAIEMEMANPGERLAPQMVANVKILRKMYEQAIVIPLDALVQSETGWTVFVEEGGKARSVDVQTLAVYEDRAVVEGLGPDQRLVVVGQSELSDGDPITVAET